MNKYNFLILLNLMLIHIIVPSLSHTLGYNNQNFLYLIVSHIFYPHHPHIYMLMDYID